ncbi:MAG: histidine kinase [Bacteroidia bacterium]|nr:histidine kinase [Bacteroidia bacterium]
MNKKITLGILFLFLSAFLRAQEPYFLNIRMEQGLPSNYVYSVFQDRDGFLWFGTNAGVARYDGYNFEIISLNDGLTSNDVFEFFQDSRGRIWFRTWNGKPCYYFEGKMWNPDNAPFLKEVKIASYISGIVEDQDGNIWMNGFRGGISKICPDGTVENIPRNATFWGLIVSEENRLMTVEGEGFYEMDSQGNFIPLICYPYRRDFGRICTLDETIFYFYKQQIISFDARTRESRKFLFSKKLEETIHVTLLHDRYWFSTRGGTFVGEDKENISFNHLFRDNTVTCVFEDREGTQWICTHEDGVYYTPAPGVRQYREKDGIAGNTVLGLENENNERLWFSGLRNLYGNLSNDQVTAYCAPFFSPVEIPKLRYEPDEGLWVIGKTGLALVNGKKISYLPIWGNDFFRRQKGDYLYSTHVTQFLEKEWVASHLSPYPPDSLMSIRFDNVINSRANDFCKGKGNQVWAGTVAGLVLLENDSIIPFEDKESLVNCPIGDLCYLPDEDMLLIGTLGHGLVIRKPDGTFEQVGGGINEMVYAIAATSNNEIWLGTRKGVYKGAFEAGELRIINMGIRIGLEHLKVNDIEVFQGKVYLATDDGLAFFDPDGNVRRQSVPLIYITQVHVNGVEVPDSVHEFNYLKNSISISFLGLHIRDHGNLTYHYRLASYDSTWQTTASREVNFRALPTGDYTFEVRAENNQGQLSPVASYSFQILAPFWTEGWFLVAILLFVVVFLILGWRVRFNFLRKRYELEQTAIQAEKEKVEIERNLLELEQQSLRMQMNPHFIFNALNTIKGYYAEARDQEASGYITKFSRLLRLILESGDQLISLEKEIQILTLFLDLARVRYDNKFDFEFEVSPAVSREETGIPPMLLQPLVENAIIHGIGPKKEASTIRIGFQRQGESLLCWVQDDGIGRSRAEKRESRSDNLSHSTQVVKDRLRLITQRTGIASTITYFDLQNDDGSPAGTRAEVLIPYQTIW